MGGWGPVGILTKFFFVKFHEIRILYIAKSRLHKNFPISQKKIRNIMYKNNLHFRYILLRGHLELAFIIDYIKQDHSTLNSV